MNFKKFKYRSLLLGLGATMLLSTSCKDFLDVDVYDQYSPSALNSKANYYKLTTPLYGGNIWFQYEQKFAWCVNEGIPGVLFNVNDQEGALFLLSIGDDNSILKEGYTSLYSGVISKANQVIKVCNDSIAADAYPSDMTKEEMESVCAEARLFRGYAHFLATEYFGEVPLVMNSESDIAESKTLPRVSRRTLYKAIEQDLLYAYQYLPETQTETWRATKYSAAAMLAKLYLTMASCRVSTPGIQYPYVCDNPDLYMATAGTLLDEVINSGKFALTSHADQFSYESSSAPSSESVLALYWVTGSYGEGSAYQSQMALSGDWSPGSGWGSGKGLTYTLYNSFDESDARKQELCFYVGTGEGRTYTMANGTEAYYGSIYTTKKKDNKKAIGATGKDFLSSGQHLLNNIKKYVWGVDGTSFHGSGMSIQRRQDLIRLSDVYMMRAELNMMKQNPEVTAQFKDPAILDDINKVLIAHGAPTIDSIAYFQDLSVNHPSHETTNFTVTVDDGNGGSETKTISVEHGTPMYHNAIRTDLMQQRRKEFAMEGYAWIDLKRFFYRNPTAAAMFMYQMDRSCCFTNSPEIPENDGAFENETGYQRLALVNKCNEQLKNMYPDGTYKAGDPEVTIYLESFLANNRWYLPIPASAKTYLQTGVQDLYDDVVSGAYQY